MSALDFVRQTASAHQAKLATSSSASLVFDVSPTLTSGRRLNYRLHVESAGGMVTVREETPVLLPAFCPERHINGDGTFCLYWAEGEPLQIRSNEDAAIWWGKVLVFLSRQNTATALREWPGKGLARAHGDAARHQAQAESAAARLGETFSRALQEKRLAVRKRSIGGSERLRLYLDEQRVVAVLVRERRTMTLRSKCKCDGAATNPRPLKSCGTHAKDLADLALSLKAWEDAEVEFYRKIKAKRAVCCGTMDDCPLAQNNASFGNAA